MTFKPNPELDLVLERTVDVPSSFVWNAWTDPNLLKQWFCPKPWQTVEAEIDLRPGGTFRTVMQGPEGQRIDNAGCFLEVVVGTKLVWTASLAADYRPKVMATAHGDTGAEDAFTMTAIIEIASTPQGGTIYTATVLHADAASRLRHEAMGFHQGWGAAFDQLVALSTK